jgi:hypothetical protein
MPDKQGKNGDTHIIFNTYSFPTTTIATGTSLSVRLDVRYLSWFNVGPYNWEKRQKMRNNLHKNFM